MKNKIAFVAVGQAGGNIGQALEEKGYTVLYINTSNEDLDTLERAKFKYHIPNGEGCNKDRRKAKKLVIDDFDQIYAEIDTKLKADLIFVIFASGGGTGSGAGPMLIDLLIGEGKQVGAITVIPSQSESVKSHINCYDCFSELENITETSACFILDNDKGEKLALNQMFVNVFCEFLDIPDKQRSIQGNIDKAEIMETLKAHGMALVVQQQSKEESGIINAVRHSIYAPLEADRAIKYIAASGDVKMPDMEKAFGVPIDNFQTFNAEGVICCLSGLSYPRSRLDIVYKKVSDNKEIIKKNLSAAMESSLKSDVNFLDELEQKKNVKEQQKPQSKRDIMSKYF